MEHQKFYVFSVWCVIHILNSFSLVICLAYQKVHIVFEVLNKPISKTVHVLHTDPFYVTTLIMIEQENVWHKFAIAHWR